MRNTLLISLCAGLSLSGHATADNFFKRQYAAPPGGWDNPELYKDVDWAAVFNVGKAAAVATPQPATPAVAAGPIVHAKLAVNADGAEAANSNDGPAPSTSGSTTSSASCPPGCSMTISFTDDSDSVDFTTGGNGLPLTGKTRSSCICLNGGSVRVNVGTTNRMQRTTLIEGSAMGLSTASFYDVSYVEGYTHPVVCWSKEDPSMSGSNIDLYAHGKCETGGNRMGDICENPGYGKLVNGGDSCWKCTLPSAFFHPASGAAYTYPYDDATCASGPQSEAGHYRSPLATGGSLTCCVGTQCRPNTFSAGGTTSMANCNRPDCRPCASSGAVCTTGCTPGTAKRSIERVFESADRQYFKRSTDPSHQSLHEQGLGKRAPRSHFHRHTAI